MLDLIPLNDRIIVRPNVAEETVNGLFLPDQSRRKPKQGIVLAVGDGVVDESGNKRPLTLRVGDEVIYGWVGEKFANKLTGEELLVMREDDVLATVTHDEK
jgi:chaperonin GroES